MLPGVDRRHPDIFAQGAFVEILGGGMSSRLFQEVREHRGLAYAIDAYADCYADTGVLGVYAGSSADTAADTARVAAEQITGLIGKVEAAELSRAKAQLKAATFMAAESTMARAEQAAGQLLTFGRLFSIAETAEAIDAVTAADLARVGERVLSKGVAASAVLGSKRAMPAAEAFQRTLFG